MLQPLNVNTRSEKLEIINLQLALSRNAKRKKLIVFFSLLAVIIISVFVLLIKLDSPYLGWDYSDPERSVVGVLFHALREDVKTLLENVSDTLKEIATDICGHVSEGEVYHYCVVLSGIRTSG